MGHLRTHWVENSAEVSMRRNCLDVCLRVGVDVRQKDVDGMTSLIWAANYNELSVLQQLLGVGAPINATNFLGMPSLHCAACRSPNVAIIDRLLLGRRFNSIYLN